MKTPEMTYDSWMQEIEGGVFSKMGMRDFLCHKICDEFRCADIDCENCFFHKDNVDVMYAEVMGESPQYRINVLESVLRVVVDKIEDNGIILDDPDWSKMYDGLINVLGEER